MSVGIGPIKRIFGLFVNVRNSLRLNFSQIFVRVIPPVGRSSANRRENGERTIDPGHSRAG